MDPKLPTDEDTNLFFDDIVSKLISDLDYSYEEASKITRDYYQKFTNVDYCRSIGVPVQDDDFFFHEGVGGMALRIHYYLKLNEDPNPRKFIDWRASRHKKKA